MLNLSIESFINNIFWTIIISIISSLLTYLIIDEFRAFQFSRKIKKILLENKRPTTKDKTAKHLADRYLEIFDSKNGIRENDSPRVRSFSSSSSYAIPYIDEILESESLIQKFTDKLVKKVRINKKDLLIKKSHKYIIYFLNKTLRKNGNK